MLCKLNREALSELFGNHLVIFKFTNFKPRSVSERFRALRGDIDGVMPRQCEQAIELIKRHDLRRVFVDGSNLGGFVSKLKHSLPDLEVITFFHNVEARFFWGAFTADKTLHSFAVFVANFLAERKAVHFSNKLICLSERDSYQLLSFYGRGATHVSPLALVDEFATQANSFQNEQCELFALFVGGNFYANREGIAWFAQHVAHRIDIKVCVVGQGMENLRGTLNVPGRVEVIGSVDNIGDWYRRAAFVIAPIFDGSGMKTKVAEALMFGKRVIGTREAFSGYEDVLPTAGEICKSADDFVVAIRRSQQTSLCAMDEQLRALYVRNYSYPSACQRLKNILAD